MSKPDGKDPSIIYDAPVIQKRRCLRCEYEFYPQTPEGPKHCPNPDCNSPYWRLPRRREKA